MPIVTVFPFVAARAYFPIRTPALKLFVANNASVAIVEPQAARRSKGLELGAQVALDPTAPDFAEAVAEATKGRGFDVVIEAAGSPIAMAQALEIAGPGARVVYVGIDVGAKASAQLGLIQSKALRIRGLIGSVGLWPRVIRFIASGVIDPTAIVTATFPLVDALTALDAARDTANNIKVHLATSA